MAQRLTILYAQEKGGARKNGEQSTAAAVRVLFPARTDQKCEKTKAGARFCNYFPAYLL
jgi:hypothetical protein